MATYTPPRVGGFRGKIPPPVGDPASVPVTFCSTTAEAVAAIEEWGSAIALGIDTETEREETINPYTAKLVVISAAATFLGTEGLYDKAYVFHVRDMDRKVLAQAIREVGCRRPERKLTAYGWNADFDDPVLSMNLTGESMEWFKPLLWWKDLQFAEGAIRLGASGNNWYASLAEAARHRLGIEVEGKGTTQLSYNTRDDLTEEQIRYAAQDAVITLWLSAVYTDLLATAELTEVFQIECGARPLFQLMNRAGLPIDREGWMAKVAEFVVRSEEVMDQLATMTGGGQLSIFGSAIASWKPGSDDDVKRILNEYEPERVKAYIAGQEGHFLADGTPDAAKGRLLGKSDSVDKTALKLIGGELAKLIAEHRALQKYPTTYGASMMALTDDNGRFHPEYTQCLIDTGRSSSRRINAQNLQKAQKPLMNPWFRVDSSGKRIPRVFVHGDFSQAELRFMAQMTGEPVRREAFAKGIDQHVAVGGQMFGLDMEALKAIIADPNDPYYLAYVEAEKAKGTPESEILSPLAKAEADHATYKDARQRAKVINFGLGYGMRGKLLATTLTLAGSPTTTEEANALIDAFFAALPLEAKWLSDRDEFVAQLSKNLPKCDWTATRNLHRLHPRVMSAAKELKKQLGRSADASEIAEFLESRADVENTLAEQLGRQPSPEELETELQSRVETVQWAQMYLAPVVLTEDGMPFSFESRTLAGRRRLFQVSAEAWISSMVFKAARLTQPAAEKARDEWAEANNVVLSTKGPRGSKALPNSALKKIFEKKELKYSFLNHMLSSAKAEFGPWLMEQALADRVRGMANAYRNAPIQGGVADAVVRCFAELYPQLEEIPFAAAVLSVHDSIVIECDLADAQRVREMLKATMEAALAFYCPDVKVVADVDIQASLDADRHTIEPEEIDAIFAEIAAAEEAGNPFPSVRHLLDVRSTAEADAAAAAEESLHDLMEELTGAK